MTERDLEREAGDVKEAEEPPKTEEHWHGYPGTPEAQSYTVPAPARYGLFFALMILAAMMLAVAFMTRVGM